MVASTWLGDHQGRPSAPLIRCVKPSKYEALTNTLELELAQYSYQHKTKMRLKTPISAESHNFYPVLNQVPLDYEQHA